MKAIRFFFKGFEASQRKCFSMKTIGIKRFERIFSEIVLHNFSSSFVVLNFDPFYHHSLHPTVGEYEIYVFQASTSLKNLAIVQF